MYSPTDTSNDSLFNSSSSQFSFPFGDGAGQTGPVIVLHNQMMLQQQFLQYSATSYWDIKLPFSSSYLVRSGNFIPFGPPQDISVLQEHCNLLEQQLMKVTTECNTVKSLFNKLASAVQMPLANPSNLATLPLYLKKPKLVNQNMALKTWGKLAENGWKLEYLCMKSYSAWSKHHLDDSGHWKKVIKDEDGSESDSNSKKKCKISSASPFLSSKKIKDCKLLTIVDTGDEKLKELPALQAPAIPHVKDMAPLIAKSQLVSGYTELASANGSCQQRGTTIPTLSPIHYSASLPIESSVLPTSTSPKRGAAGNGETMVATNDKENVPSLQWAESVPRPAISCNPMNMLTAAAARVKMAALPPPPLSNLCIIRWQKQVNKDGTKDKFQMYYDSLTKTQHKAYDEEAKDLVQKNAWVKATIENGTLH
ncbi:hypothetical protein EDC04DRAFT_2614100 [Pisolithus marmoratus]|nr:hypothetical protein EDC04DRAFT_2614100 [Pisolithus marmoratus]